MTTTTTPRLELVAHRGHAGAFPENTLAAVRSAVELGASWIEIDVQLSRDGEFVLFHDPTLERVCARAGAVHEFDAPELRRFPAHEPERFGERFVAETIAELTQVVDLIAAHPNVRLFVEVKPIAVEQHGVDVVATKLLPTLAPLGARAIPISFSYELLEALRDRRAAADLSIGTILRSWDAAEREKSARLAPEFTFCNHLELPARGRLELDPVSRLALYEVVDPELARGYAERGAELIESFEFAEMKQQLESSPS